MTDIDIETLRDTYRKHHWRWFKPEAMWRDVVTLLDALVDARAEVERLRSSDGFVAAVEAEAKRYHEAECFYRIERNAARAEATRLTALLHAKEAWIEGAKVDLDGYDAARAALADAEDAIERLGGMVEWLSEVVVDAREALTPPSEPLRATLLRGDPVENALTILNRERNANPSRLDEARAALRDANDRLDKVQALREAEIRAKAAQDVTKMRTHLINGEVYLVANDVLTVVRG